MKNVLLVLSLIGSCLVYGQITVNVTQASTATVMPGSVDQVLMRLEVVSSAAVSVEKMRFESVGNTELDFPTLKVYYTGTTPTFSTGNLFISGATPTINTASTFNAGTPQAIPAGTSYFWVAVDISATATSGNTVDMEFKWIRTVSGGTTNYGNVTNPAGVRLVAATPMAYSSYSVFQASTSNVAPGEVDAPILGVNIVTTGSTSPISLSDLEFNLFGSTSIADFSGNVKVYYTGNSNAFATTNLFGSMAVPVGVGTWQTINGSQTLVQGNNYFWFAVDVSPGATANNVIDARCRKATVNGIDVIGGSVQNPAGNRLITLSIGPGGVNNGITVWLDATSGVLNGAAPATNGGVVSKWSNKAVNANFPELVQTQNARRPIFNSNKFNFNPTLYFDGSNDRLQGAFLGSDFLNSTQNTVIAVHKYYGGIVVFKFAKDGVNGSIQYEAAPGNYRFDFITNQYSTATQYVNEIRIFSTRSNHGGNVLMNNNALQILSAPSAGAFPVNLSKDFYMGENPQPAYPLNASMDFAELIIYPTDLADNELRKVESYLAIKYGVTLGVNGVSLNYYNSNFNSIWNATTNTGYAYDIAGLLRDDRSQLSQIKSHSENEITVGSGNYRDIVTIANGTNFNSPATLSADLSSFVWGHNGGVTQNTGSVVNYPTDNGEVIQTIFSRHWKAQETGTVGTVTLEFKLSAVAGVGNVLGANDLQYLRLLVDEDGDFSVGATSLTPISYNNVTDIAYFQLDFTPSTGNPMTQNKGFYFTLGSTNFNMTPLPSVLSSLDTDIENCQASIFWNVVAEINTAAYLVEKSANGIDWVTVDYVPATGLTNGEATYRAHDEYIGSGLVYYRVTSVDVNGTRLILKTIARESNCDKESFIVYPNPSNGNFSIYASLNGEYELVDVQGKLIQRGLLIEGENSMLINQIQSGMYFVHILDELKNSTLLKVIID